MVISIGSVVTSTGGRKLEGLDGEGEVLVIGIIDKEPVVDVFLKTLGLIACWNKGTSRSWGGALLDSCCLG